MATAIEFEVNGTPQRVDDDGATSLLLALRNNLDMRGTRHGCATGLCGASTVMIAGRPTTSCNTPHEAVAGRRVETIEGVERDAAGTALLAAFLSEQAGQCGYCLAGILVEAKAFLAANKSPSRAEIAAALDGHLCRCGAHHRILTAIERAAHALQEGTTA